MTTKKPSIRDVARIADVSLATVSNVFSGKKRVKESSKARVLEAAKNLGYQVDRAASQLRSGKNNTVAVLVPNLTDTFFSTIVSELERLALEKHYDIIVASTHGIPEIEESRISTLMAWRPAGLIVVPTDGRLPESFSSKEFSIPLVLVDRIQPDIKWFDTVTINNHETGYAVGMYLKSKGHERILVAASDLKYPPIRARLQGFLEAMKPNTDMIKIVELGDEHREGPDAVIDAFKEEPRTTAVFALNYTTTLDSLAALSELELFIGRDISLIAFDDNSWMAARMTGLTAVRQPMEDIAKTSWARLLSHIENTDQDFEPASKVLKATLIERESVIDLNKQESDTNTLMKIS